MILTKDVQISNNLNKMFDCRQCKYHKRVDSLLRDASEHICELSNKDFERSTRSWYGEPMDFIEDFCELKTKDEMYFSKIGNFITATDADKIFRELSK